MRIECDWDPAKAAINLIKHKVSFEDAMAVFRDPLALTRADPEVSDEDRWITIGLSYGTKLLLVVHTHVELDADNAYVRIISARKPSKKEVRQYEQDT